MQPSPFPSRGTDIAEKLREGIRLAGIRFLDAQKIERHLGLLDPDSPEFDALFEDPEGFCLDFQTTIDDSIENDAHHERELRAWEEVA